MRKTSGYDEENVKDMGAPGPLGTFHYRVAGRANSYL